MHQALYTMLTSFLLSFFLLACGAPTPTPVNEVPNIEADDQVPSSWLNEEGTTIRTRFLAPEGFSRSSYPAAAFGNFLQEQPLKANGTQVYLFSGALKGNQTAHAAVLDVDVEPRDLQQCADAVMRLRAEYLYEYQRYDDIHFNFVSGFNAEFARWRRGERIQVKGNKVNWVGGGRSSADYRNFRKYLTMVFSYAGTASLVHELKPKPTTAIEAGDVLIKGGSPGHAVIVVDKAVNEQTGEVLVLLAQSYMPAQDIHVLVNPRHRDGNPWYSVQEDFGSTLRTAEYTFYEGALRGW